MSKVAVLTVIHDNYDTLKPVVAQSNVEVEWILVTDVQPEDSLGWTIVVEPRPNLNPKTASKPPKTTPWKYTDSDSSIYIDASFRIISPTMVYDMMVMLSEENPIAQWVHPWRNCCYDEARYCMDLGKYAGQPLKEMIHRYMQHGHPAHWGLWASGCIARKHTPAIKQFGLDWQNEINHYGFQCQVSEPSCLRVNGLRPISLPGTHFANPWMQYEASGRH